MYLQQLIRKLKHATYFLKDIKIRTKSWKKGVKLQETLFSFVAGSMFAVLNDETNQSSK